MRAALEAPLLLPPAMLPLLRPAGEEVGFRQPRVSVMPLTVTRQRLRCYEPGEIAHVENVLEGEYRERVHRRSRRIEEARTVETESREESERDLQSTERFSLKRQITKTLDEEHQFGTNVEVTYRGSVTVVWNAAYEGRWAENQTRMQAQEYSRELTERARSRVEERVREERVRKTVEEFEETNTHGLDNRQSPDGHVVGIYRWLDVLYACRVDDLGRRMVLDLTVPEPAAGFRHSWDSLRTAVPERPHPPEMPDGTSLTPSKLDATNYLDWAEKYGSYEAEPPPPEFRTLTKTFRRTLRDDFGADGQDGIGSGGEQTGVAVPEGYTAEAALVLHGAIDGEGEAADAPAWLLIGDQKINLKERNLVGESLDLEIEWTADGKTSAHDPAPDLPLSVIAGKSYDLTVVVTVVCRRRDEWFDSWKLRTYNAIYDAYRERQMAYQEEVAAAATRAGIEVSGRSPARHREIERAELKRAAISFLQGRDFDCGRPREPAGEPPPLPAIGFDEIEPFEPRIRFFEQAFDWTNMTYHFFPYYWSREPAWDLRIAAAGCIDPLFERFLTAGAARLVIPVQAEAERHVAYFLQTRGALWLEDDPPLVDDDFFLPLLADLAEGRDAGEDRDSEGAGSDGETPEAEAAPAQGSSWSSLQTGLAPGEWEIRLPTTLVWLQPDGRLPGCDESARGPAGDGSPPGTGPEQEGPAEPELSGCLGWPLRKWPTKRG